MSLRGFLCRIRVRDALVRCCAVVAKHAPVDMSALPVPPAATARTISALTRICLQHREHMRATGGCRLSDIAAVERILPWHDRTPHAVEWSGDIRTFLDTNVVVLGWSCLRTRPYLAADMALPGHHRVGA